MLEALMRALLGRGMGPDPEDVRDGCRVWFAPGSRGEAVLYEEGPRRLLAEVTAEVPGSTTLYLASIARWEAEGRPLTEAERARVAARIAGYLARRGGVRLEAGPLPSLDEALPGLERELARHGWRLRRQDGVMMMEREHTEP